MPVLLRVTRWYAPVSPTFTLPDDGRLVGELASPTADSVLEQMMKLGN